MQIKLKPFFLTLICALAGNLNMACATEESIAAAQTDTTLVAQSAEAPVQMDTMEIKGVAASVPAVPVNLPASSEGVTATQIDESINAVSSGEVLKYLPSVHVRERFSGDVNGGLAIRMTGVNQSAENIVYADGMLLSNFLNNSCCPGPRWGMVTPEEIDRVDVIYGPFSALYPGNAEGGVVLMTTHMPRKFEAHAKVDVLSENFSLYGTDKKYSGVHGAAELGNKVGNWSFWVNVDRLDNNSHPTDFVVAAARKSTDPAAVVSGPGTNTTVVNGAVTDLTLNNAARVITGSLSTDHTVKDDIKIKLGYDFSPTVRATYTFDNWQNTSDKKTESYLTDAATGSTIYGTGSGVYKYVRINGKDYTAAPTGSNELQDFSMHGLSVKSDTGGQWDWSVVGSLFNYDKDVLRTSGSASGTTPAAAATGGTINFTDGTGWQNLDLRGEFRPDGDRKSTHQLSFGYHTDTYITKSYTYNLLTGTSWLTDATGAKTASSLGKTETQAIYLQDAWQLAPAWQLVGGGRLEHWQAFDGSNFTTASGTVTYQKSAVSAFSPKFALSYQANQDLTLRASLGRANRFPTVQELFANTAITNLSTGAAATGLPAPYNTQLNNNPNLKPEVDDAWEFTAERFFEKGVWRNSLFGEEKKGALISQANTTTLPGYSISSTQNVDKIRSYGFESSFQTKNALSHGLDLSGSVAYIHSMIVADAANPLLENTVQPLIPMWRGSLVATYHASEKLSYTIADRFSGRQHSGLFSTTTKAYPDPNPNVYGGRSTFNVVDVKVLYKVNKQWAASAGVNNIGNLKYFTLYPYAQRTYFASLKFDL